MFEFLRKLFQQIKDVYTKLDSTKKIIIGVVVGVVLISFITLFTITTERPNVLLFSDLPAEDFGLVTKKLEEMGYYYNTRGTTDIFVNPDEREIILTRLAQEDMIPKGIPGWKLFDISKWTETDREIDVKYMRALRDEIKKHIESLRNIDNISLNITVFKHFASDLFKFRYCLCWCFISDIADK